MLKKLVLLSLSGVFVFVISFLIKGSLEKEKISMKVYNSDTSFLKEQYFTYSLNIIPLAGSSATPVYTNIPPDKR